VQQATTWCADLVVIPAKFAEEQKGIMKNNLKSTTTGHNHDIEFSTVWIEKTIGFFDDVDN
jgi:hypothetical protein